MADDTRTFEEIQAEQDKLHAEAAAQPEPEGYDAWFREQVEAALKESEAPDAVLYTPDEVRAAIARERARRGTLYNKAS